MKFYVRLEEAQKTVQPLVQRDTTYEAAAVLRRAGYDVEVREWFTGDSKMADAESIVVKFAPRP